MNRVTVRQFAAMMKSGAPGDDALIVCRQFPATVSKGPEAERRLKFVISTARQDRERDTIALDGWDLEAYRRNPVVLWAHNHAQLPIARAENLELRDGALSSEAVFPEPGIHDLSDQIFRLASDGFIHAASVGFVPRKWSYRDDGGINFEEHELIEWSIVTVPANSDALAIDGAGAAAAASAAPPPEPARARAGLRLAENAAYLMQIR